MTDKLNPFKKLVNEPKLYCGLIEWDSVGNRTYNCRTEKYDESDQIYIRKDIHDKVITERDKLQAFHDKAKPVLEEIDGLYKKLFNKEHPISGADRIFLIKFQSKLFDKIKQALEVLDD